MNKIRFHLNGSPIEQEVESRTLLVDLIRGALHQTGTHVGCDTSQCGCCTVLVNGDATKSCSMLAVQAQGCEIVTIEGLATGESLHPIQKAFMEHHGLQCGFCTPGMIMTAACLLKKTPNPSDEEIEQALEGNLCRCTGYVNIVRAVRHAALSMNQADR